MFLNAYDIGAIVLLILFSVMGGIRGFTWEAGTLVAVMLGIAAANRLSSAFATTFLKRLPETLAPIIGFILVFLLTFILLLVITHYAKRLVDSAKLKKVDQTLGALFGTCQGALICLVLTLLILHFGTADLKNYVSSTYTAHIVGRISSYIPRKTFLNFKHFKE